MNLLLLSNSTKTHEPYLGWTLDYIKQFANKHHIQEALFIPYAGINVGDNPKNLTESYNCYENRVQEVFSGLKIQIHSIHHVMDPLQAVQEAACIVVGGGNTFHLVFELHRRKLMNAISKRVKKGIPYIGWSAGSNIACPTLCTTNDMPIVDPTSFKCMNLILFQINPHYLDTDKHPKDHGGETREQRITEFLTVNKKTVVVGLRELSLLEVEGTRMELKGQNPLRIFRYGKPAEELPLGDVTHLLELVK